MRLASSTPCSEPIGFCGLPLFSHLEGDAMLARYPLIGVVFTVTSLAGIAQTYGQAIQWSGNGHWYEVITVANISFEDANVEALDLGGYLATIASLEEDQFVLSLVLGTPNAWFYLAEIDRSIGPWIGGYQIPDSMEPDDGWRWVTDEPWKYTNWSIGQPDNGNGGGEGYLHFSNLGSKLDGTWNDRRNDDQNGDPGYVVEYDLNPDCIAQEPNCSGDANGDAVVDPFDLGFVLSRFECAVGAGDEECDSADQNCDGVVDPLDAGYVLARFGECR